ncbi:MAG: prephenate dehydratase domain-containing protein [Methanomicrobium sp.]|nr:prephenate dehydratase domain-containing protein [Methanomicrobium sp.]
MTIAVLGPRGTFSCELAEKIKEDGEEIILLPTIHDVFTAVTEKKIRGIVPVENSEAGGVGETLDGLLQTDCKITAEYYMPIRHFFVSKYNPADISVIYTHPQSHEQAGIFLRELKGVSIIHTSSNAQSAKEAESVLNSAAVTTESAAKLYKLPLLKKDIQNSNNNTTRFLEISSLNIIPDKPEKCSIVVIPKDNRPGLLYGILEIFAHRGINLTRIESRPSKEGIGRYVFFIDFETDNEWKSAISELKEITGLKELVCYKKRSINR